MYTVAVKIDGLDRRRRTTGLVHLLIGFFLLIKSFDLLTYLVEKNALKLLPFLVVAGASLFYGFFRTRVDFAGKFNGPLRFVQFASFFSFAIVMKQTGHGFDSTVMVVWALVIFLLLFTEKKIFDETMLWFTEDGIRIPGTYKEHLVEWSAVDNVTVRHDFITVFHRDKKYLQYQVLQDLSELEVVKMNAFCREKIEQVGKLTS